MHYKIENLIDNLLEGQQSKQIKIICLDCCLCLMDIKIFTGML